MDGSSTGVDDCGSLPAVDLLNNDDSCSITSTASSFANCVHEGCSSLVDLGSISGYMTRISFLSTAPCCTASSEGGRAYVCLETSQSLEECRHHGSDDAAAALDVAYSMHSSLRLDQAAELSTFQIGSQPAFQHWPFHERGPAYAEKPICDGCGNSKHHSNPHALPLTRFKRLSRLVEESGAPETLRSAALGRTDDGAEDRRLSRCTIGGDAGCPAASSHDGGGSAKTTQGSLLNGPPSPLSAVFNRAPTSPARHEGKEPRLSAFPSDENPSSTPSPMTPVAFAIIAANITATQSPFAIASPASGASPAAASFRRTTTHITTAAFSEPGLQPSPFAICVYDSGVPPYLDHELPDDTVHGGRPRHPSIPGSRAAGRHRTRRPPPPPLLDRRRTALCGSLLFEWAELETLNHAAVHSSDTEVARARASHDAPHPDGCVTAASAIRRCV